jgi:flagellar protein FlbD
MIKVTRLNDSVMVINVEKIQSLQATPDTVITFTNKDKIMVKEPVEEISQRIVDYQRNVNCNPDGAGLTRTVETGLMAHNDQVTIKT